MNEPSAPPATPEWLRALGPRTTRRPEPRFGVLISVVGSIAAVIGAFALAGSGDDPNLGVVFIALAALTGGGYLALWVYQSGPLATAGATASALALPIALFILIDGLIGDNEPGEVSAELILALSIAGWMAAFLVGPGRGHVVYVGFSCVFLGYYLADQMGGGLFTDGAATVDTAQMWALMLIAAALIGAGYLLDRASAVGIATVSAGSGTFFALFATVFAAGAASITIIDESEPLIFGLGFTSTDLSASDLVIPGLVMVVGGVAMALYGASHDRRATAWTGTAATVVGFLMFARGLAEDSVVTFGIMLIVLGLAATVGGVLLAARLAESNELGESAPAAATRLMDAFLPPGRTRSAVGPWPGGPSSPPPPPASATPVGVTPASTPAPAPAPDPPPAPAPGPTPAPAPAPDLPPAPGWWKASDDKWYPPE